MLDLSRNVDYTDYIYHNFGYYEDEEAIKEEDPDDPILVEFPTSVTRIRGLRSLSINFHLLRSVPDDIGFLTELRVLRCSDNRYACIWVFPLQDNDTLSPNPGAPPSGGARSSQQSHQVEVFSLQYVDCCQLKSGNCKVSFVWTLVETKLSHYLSTWSAF